MMTRILLALILCLLPFYGSEAQTLEIDPIRGIRLLGHASRTGHRYSGGGAG